LALVAVIGVASWSFVPLFREHPGHFVWAWIGAIGYGFTPLWYFEGIERLRGAAALEVGARAGATAGVFAFVRDPADGWIVLALRAVSDMVSTGLLTAWMYRTVRPLGLAYRAGWEA